MAEQYLIYDDSLSCIGDAIRAKYGDTTKYYPREMPEAIRGIPSGEANETWARIVERTATVFGDYSGMISFMRNYAFNYCTQLESMYLLSNNVVSYSGSPLGLTPFYSTSYIGHYGSIYVPNSLVSNYKQTAGIWSALSARIGSYNVSLGVQRGSESNQYLIYDETLTNIGGAIRERLNEADEYYPRNMPDAILRIGGMGGDCDSIAKGIIEDTLNSLNDTSNICTGVGSTAFYGMTYLSTVNLPAAAHISSDAFAYCYSLENANFAGCERIESSAFRYCSKLKTISFPNCKYISHHAFMNCTGLTDFTFPACETVDVYAFLNCTNLGTIRFPKCTSLQSTETGLGLVGSPFAGAIISSVIFDILPTLETYAFGDMQNGESAQVSYIECLECSIINSGAFTYCSIIEASFPKCITIGDAVFSGHSELTSIYFPACEEVTYRAFYSCYGLTTADFSALLSIGSQAFAYCSSLENINCPACEYIESSAFTSCWSLAKADFPKCNVIESYVFSRCSALSIASFPECTTIGAYAFYNCSSLETAYFPKCSIVGNSAFANCSLLSSIDFTLCETIGLYAFSSCSSLTTASFPALTYIYSSAFRSCTALSSFYMMGSSVVSLQGNVATTFAGTAILNSSGYFYVPASLLSEYQSARWWSANSIQSRILGI